MKNTLWVAVVIGATIATGCGAKEEGNEDDGGSGTAGAAGVAGAAAGTAGTAGTAGDTSTAGMSGASGAAGMGLCPADPMIATCGSQACAPVSGVLAMACVQNCCTDDNQCGTRNAGLGSGCTAAVVNDTMCPNETIAGTMTTGCCVPDSNDCGVIDILTGSGSCISRTNFALRFLGLQPMNCDGTTPTPTAGMGAAGMAGMAGTSGMGGMGGAAGDAGASGASGMGAAGMAGMGAAGMAGMGESGMGVAGTE